MAEHKRRILMSGATGLIGSAVLHEAQNRGIDVTPLVRERRSAGGSIYWNPKRMVASVHPVELEDFDAVIHLSGANVGRRWTENYRKEIAASRVMSTQVLCEALTEVHRKPRVLLCASAIGIYGDRGDERLTEESSAGVGFLAELCAAWEAATGRAREAGIRVVNLRFGVVLSSHGGAMAKMLPAFRLGLGGKMGSGRQWMAWATLRDVVRAILFLMEHEDLDGPFNVTAPNPVTNEAFAKALAEALHRPAWLGMPSGLLKLAFGEMAEQTVLSSQRAEPQRLEQAGFRFEDNEIEAAFRALLR